MNRLQLILAIALVSFSTLANNFAAASVMTYTNPVDWQNAAGSAAQVIDFATNDDGTPLTGSQTFYPSLTLKGVTFENVYAYANYYLFVFQPNARIHVILPANSTAFAMDLLTGDPSLGGNYVMTLSTGEVVATPATSNAGEFFGIVSTVPVAWVDVSLNTADMALDNFYLVRTAPTVKQVALDIVPGTSSNPVLLKPGTQIPVAILSSATFSALEVDVATVRFGLAGTEAPANKYTYVDVNKDGRKDLLLTFRSEQTGILCGSTSAKITGKTITGAKIAGSDSIKTMNCANN